MYGDPMPGTYRKRRVGSKKRPRRNKQLDATIAQRVAELRVKKQMAQVDLGRLLERSDAATAAHKLENAKSGFSLQDLVTLAKHFDVSLDQLVRGVTPDTDGTLTDDEIKQVLDQYAASDVERREFAEHQRIHRDHRVTASYIHVFLLALRRGRSLERAADEALAASARDSAVQETGSAERLPPGELRRRRKRE